ncbi:MULTISPECIES: hypothetical protein [unclassified Amycolatopsis]|uniref:hypothetical protein n=1 Tax=unclassified Amycolatopsis TaxID=2618356 RepID=UPI00287655FE|nr:MULTISPECIES: hypothetical protein [unclassified Amycolatopsis]MDS0140557.1 hypothetical protein [Amycolatopsis sp. 505]MDS0149207.1 hypothetical protein [Amycolatopsis sp. CM201R]
MPWNDKAPRRRWPLVLGGLAVLLVGLLVAALVYVGQHDAPAPAATPQDAPAVPDQLEWGPLTWSQLEGTQVPLSAEHGPREHAGPLAEGFTHDLPGAVLAAVNIAARSSGLAGGEEMFRPTIARQTTGEVMQYLAATQDTYREALGRGGAPVPLVIGYRLAGTNTADDVRIDIVGRLTNRTDPRLKALITGTLHVRWIGGDWKLVVPTGAGQQVKAVPPGFHEMPGQRLTLAG